MKHHSDIQVKILNKINNQRGQALMLSLIVFTVGSIIMVPLLGFISTATIGTRVYQSKMKAQYTADSGVEDAIWKLRYTTLITDTLNFSGAATSYVLPETVNGVSPSVAITRDYQQWAADDFESGGFLGGSGWLAGWTNSGDSAIVTSGTPYQGSYHLRLQSSTGYVKRAANLAGKYNVWLEFYAKVNSFESGDTAILQVSPDGTTWTTIKTWTSADVDNTYQWVRIDLSPYAMTSSFWIAFDANMSATNDQFYIDNLAVLSRFPQTQVGLPAENFETGDWTAGSGWLSGWTHSGDSLIVSTGTPHTGTNHLRLRTSNGYVARPADLTGRTNLHLQFWAKVNSFEGGDSAIAQVSSNGTVWTTVKTWTSADSDNTYHFVDIDLTPYTMSSTFWIAFDANMNSTNDQLYIDDIEMVGPAVFEIISSYGNRNIRADVKIVSATVHIFEWQMQ